MWVFLPLVCFSKAHRSCVDSAPVLYARILTVSPSFSCLLLSLCVSPQRSFSFSFFFFYE